MTSQPNQPFPTPMPVHSENPDGTPDATREVDGQTVLDADLNDDLIDSVEADMIASGADGDD